MPKPQAPAIEPQAPAIELQAPASDEPSRGYYDLGGLAAGPIDRRERKLHPWETTIAALRVLLGEGKLHLVDLEELRHCFETFGEGLYRSLGFFERMLESTVTILDAKGVLARDAIVTRAQAIAARIDDREFRRLFSEEPIADPDPYGGSGWRAVSTFTSPPTPAALRCEALRELLLEKQLLTPDEVRRGIEAIEAPGTHWGAQVIAHAWNDAAFRAAILDDGMAAMAWLGKPFRDGRLTVLAHSAGVHNLVVCTLCSCYPRNLLGQPPAWYVSKAFRARAVTEPRAVLAEFGTVLPDDTQIRVHDSTAELRYLVLPMRPAGTQGWSEERLAGLVTRDAMIGVSLPRVIP